MKVVPAGSVTDIVICTTVLGGAAVVTGDGGGGQNVGASVAGVDAGGGGVGTPGGGGQIILTGTASLHTSSYVYAVPSVVQAVAFGVPSYPATHVTSTSNNLSPASVYSGKPFELLL